MNITECKDNTYGAYGYNCLDTCSIKCGVPGRCDRVTGQCEGGCQVGWNGIRCDTGEIRLKLISVLFS